MQIDVGARIADLLYENQSVTIPGVGAFVAAYKPAGIDQIEGKILPPAKQISFNKNLLIDDGLLVKQLREKYRLTYGEAMRAVDDFAKQVKDKIERREIVSFPQVGRLYKDYEQNYQFLPDETNFNTDSYGLPTLEYFPIARTPQEKVQAVAEVKKLATVPRARKKNWLQRNLLLVSAVAALLITTSVYVLIQNPKTNTQEGALPDVPAARVNIPPSEQEGAAAEEINTRDNEDIESDNADTESATLKPGTKSARIAIGIFSKKENVDRLIKKIYEAGYEPFTEKVGSSTRVGIQMKYDRSEELSRALQNIRKEFNTKATVYKK